MQVEEIVMIAGFAFPDKEQQGFLFLFVCFFYRTHMTLRQLTRFCSFWSGMGMEKSILMSSCF